ncbi:hypothetical protein [Bradyrhizobium sp. UNPF46]|uniref:hypothetical protein n=1 Tax=Bradyrhizobium sp. UNPF46 TaxID=1141168 RepID=UPI00114E3B53|nr:hypothetical protein [Bradyrhizobium sp. UNPF46]
MTDSEDSGAGDDVPGVPKRSLSTYARLWQLETWLRRMVYVELRALRGDDWNADIPKLGNSFQSDKRLIHMPTPEMDALSYAPLSTLKKAIDDSWSLFSPYLPPQNIWQAKLEEISQIRHRVAHFRVGHEDDLQRVIQFLRDLDKGFWHFCTSYNDEDTPLPPADDPVIAHFLDLDPFPWTEVSDKHWARIGIADPELVVAVSIEVSRRGWVQRESPVDGKPGYFYDVRFHARDRRCFDYEGFLKNTRAIHRHCAHVCLSGLDNHIRLTIPAVLGSQQVIPVVQRCLDVARNGVTRSHCQRGKAQRIANEWPEYVLGPEDPLGFLNPGMPCSFFGA